MNADPDHVPAPAGHAPRLVAEVSTGYEGIMIRERDTHPDEGKWLHCPDPVEVRQ